MIDYTEIPDDGILFEQLVRELLLREGDLDVHWTGVGPDGNRDLIVNERAIGKLGDFKRRWLVSCKHYATSGRSVGVKDITGIIDVCHAVNATGFLLVCSTQPTAALVKRLEEIASNNQIITKFWDGIELEKRLKTPATLGLIHQFFPNTSKLVGWTIYNTKSPAVWAANYRDFFIYLASRTANTFPNLRVAELIISKLESIKLPLSSDSEKKQFLRPRAIYYDNKHCEFIIFADYLVPDFSDILKPGDFNLILQDCEPLFLADGTGGWRGVWDIELKKISLSSDHFHLDHRDYYEKNMNNYTSGIPRRYTLSELESGWLVW